MTGKASRTTLAYIAFAIWVGLLVYDFTNDMHGIPIEVHAIFAGIIFDFSTKDVITYFKK